MYGNVVRCQAFRGLFGVESRGGVFVGLAVDVDDAFCGIEYVADVAVVRNGVS